MVRDHSFIRNDTKPQIAYEFLLQFHSKYGPILYRFQDKARHWLNFHIPPAFDTPIKETPYLC